MDYTIYSINCIVFLISKREPKVGVSSCFRGAQCKGPHAQHGKRPHKCDPPQCKYYGSVNHKDPAALKGVMELVFSFKFSPILLEVKCSLH